MSVLSFSLKNALNRVDNPSLDGLFSYGKYSASNAFTIFTDYQYTDGTALVLPTFDLEKVLAWKGATEFPHLGFENLQGNLNITPQPFPTFGIYLHPYYSEADGIGFRDDVGVRFNCPVTANLSIVSKVQKADGVCGDAVGYRILRNGIEVQTRTLVSQSSNPYVITTSASVIQGDIIDFIVDVGDNANSFCDDVALEVTIDVVYTKLPTPTIVSTGLNCESTTIEGKGLFVPNNVTAILCNGDEAIAYTPVSIVGGTYNSAFKFTNLDLTNFSGKQLKIRFESPLDTPSDFVFVNIGTDGNCVTFLKPVITKKETCIISTKYINFFTCNSNRTCAIAVIDTKTKEIVATSIAYDGSFASSALVFDAKLNSSSKFKTISIGLGADEGGVNEFPVTVTTFTCEKSLQTFGYIEGYVSSADRGILLMYNSDFTQETMPMFSAPINNGKFSLKIPTVIGEDYVFYALKLEY
jgi:hypothetical protein